MRIFSLLSSIGIACAAFAPSAGAQADLSGPATSPRTIYDITQLLNQYKPGSAQTAAQQAVLKVPAPAGNDRMDLYRYHRDRAHAAEALGAAGLALEEFRAAAKAIEGTHTTDEVNILQQLSGAELAAGNLANGIRLREALAEGVTQPTRLASVLINLVTLYGRLGDREAARRTGARIDAAYIESGRLPPKIQGLWRPWMDAFRSTSHAVLAWQDRQYTAADTAFREALRFHEESVRLARQRAAASQTPQSPDEHYEITSRFLDQAEGLFATFLAERDQLDEAEVATRNVLRRSLVRYGRYNPRTARAIAGLSTILLEEGRYRDAGVIARAAIESALGSGAVPSAQSVMIGRRVLGETLIAQSRWEEALAVFEELAAGARADPVAERLSGARNFGWAAALAKAGKGEQALSVARTLLQRQTGHYGAEHPEVAVAHGVLGMALAAAGDKERALREFGLALQRLATDTTSHGPAHLMRVKVVMEAYLQLLLESRDSEAIRRVGTDPVTESFRVADLVRGQSVQRALSASAARAAVSDPQLSGVVRKEQDLQQEARTLYAFLFTQLSAPEDQQLPKVVADMKRRIGEIEKERKVLGADIARRFPRYAALINPQPPTLAQVRAALRPGEAVLSFLVIAERTYAWAVPKEGPIAFAAAPLGEKALEKIVTGLRKSLDPGPVELTQIPRFDVAAAYGLYEQLLKPIEAGWKSATTLMVVANGALGTLPLSLLPTAPVQLTAGKQLFAEYRDVSWLARQAAVTQLPTVSALVTLREAPAAGAERTAFAGFGDPQFSRKQAPAMASPTALRSLSIVRVSEKLEPEQAQKPVDWMDYGDITPLPDTRDEILAIAQALKADVQKDVFLGRDASKLKVKSIDLSRRRVVAFATHGLIPGDFPGLTQPALALAAPEDPRENGLLTMEDILGLKMNADWVVLSACNTAAGDGAGAEAVSGLGRAFFYAGSRALLVTHWPVETRSAKDLVSGIFMRYSADPKLTRAEALRQAMLAVMAQGSSGSAESGFSYSHPMFWAPYALVGDGGR